MNHSNIKCSDDKQCSNNYMCTFDDKNLNHQCKKGGQNNLYLGCLDHDVKSFDYVSSHNQDDLNNFDDCLSFSRKQSNKDGMSHNYFLFKKKKVSSVDLSSINIYLLCGNKNIATFPIEDYFESSCDYDNQNCEFQAKEIFFNFIEVNKKNCNEDLYLEINYECYNENMKNKEIIPLNKISDSFSFKINCPKNKSNPKFQAKCISLYIDPQDKNKYDKINKKKLLYSCSDPIYKVPRIVKNIDKYRQNIYKKSTSDINQVDSSIEEKKKEILNLEAEKYQKIYKLNHHKEISKEKALNEIQNKKSQIKFDKNEIERKWKLFNDYDALQNILNDAQFKSAITYFGKVYTIEEAMKSANDNNQSFFVYYSNSYELDTFSSKLYFIDIYQIDNIIFDKQNWVKAKNVTTALLNFENYYDNAPNPDDDINIFKDYISNLLVYQQLMTDELKHLNNKNVDDVNNINSIVIKNLNDNLDKKITTKNQVIRMNNYQEKTNNFLINLLSILFIILFIVFIFIILYYTSKKNISH